MNCPECGGKTKVANCRFVLRRFKRNRWCLQCGARFTTYEVLDYIYKGGSENDTAESSKDIS